MELALLAMLILGAMQQCMGCEYTPVRQEVTVFGTRKFYCDYVVGGGNSSVKLSVIPGSRFRTSECSECHCTRNGLQCCGYGVRSAKLVVPNECRVLPDGCVPRLVLKSDNKSECKSDRPPVRSRPRLEPAMNLPVQVGRVRPQATQTTDNKFQAMSTATRQVQGNQAPGNKTPGQKAPRNIAPGQKAPGNIVTRQKAPRYIAPEQKAPGNIAPGRQKAAGNIAPGQKAPGSIAPGQKAPGNQGSANQGPIQQKTSPTQGAVNVPRPAQRAPTPAPTPVKPATPIQHRRPAPRGRHPNRSWRHNPFHNQSLMPEEGMQIMQQMMLIHALSGGNANPLQSFMLMNMMEM